MGRKLRVKHNVYHLCGNKYCINPMHLEERLEKDDNITETIKWPVINWRNNDVYLVHYLSNALGESKDNISKYIKVTLSDEEKVERIPIPHDLIMFVNDYEIYSSILENKLMYRRDNVEAIQELDKLYGNKDDRCLVADWGSDDSYPVIWINGNNVLAHRYAYKIKLNSIIPYGVQMLHDCDNKRCIRGSHLRYGNPKSNGEDKARRDRVYKKPYLDEFDVIEEFVALHAKGTSYRILKDLYKQRYNIPIDHKTIRKYILRHTEARFEKHPRRLKPQMELLVKHEKEIVDLIYFQGYSINKARVILDKKYREQGKPFEHRKLSEIYYAALEKIGYDHTRQHYNS